MHACTWKIITKQFIRRWETCTRSPTLLLSSAFLAVRWTIQSPHLSLSSGNFCCRTLQRLSLELRAAVDFLHRTNNVNTYLHRKYIKHYGSWSAKKDDNLRKISNGFTFSLKLFFSSIRSLSWIWRNDIKISQLTYILATKKQEKKKNSKSVIYIYIPLLLDALSGPSITEPVI